MKKLILLFFVATSIISCTESGVAPTLVITPIPSPVAEIPLTFTPPQPFERFFPTHPVVTVTQPTIPAQPTDTPIPFGDTVVEIQVQVPSIGLDRRLQGSISSQIIIVDEATGQALKRSNQAGVLLDLQQILPELLLPRVPEGCDTCVHISYNLPYGDLQGEGWLRDPVILASLENYFTLSVGPHFPPGTIAGIRRSSSPYAPAHTIALTEDGRVFTWIAAEAEVSQSVNASSVLLEAMDNLDLSFSSDPGDGARVRTAVIESQAELSQWLPFAVDIPSEEEYEVILRKGHIRFLAREDLWLLLFLKGADTLVGSSGLTRIDWSIPKFEIGYWMRNSYVGNGYMIEAVTAITVFAFDSLGAKRVEIRCDAQNDRSAAVARRVGFTQEGTLIAESRHHVSNDLRDTLIFAKTTKDLTGF